MTPELSVVIPVYQCAGCLEELYRRLCSAAEKLTSSFEIVMVEDGSRDESWATICRLAAGDRRVKGVQLSRNFGQHPAIAAGLAEVRGERVVVMDCDLQDQPEEIAKLWAAAELGVDVVLARRKGRRDAVLRRWGSRLYFAALDFLAESGADPEVGTFSLISNRVAREYVRAADRHAHYLQVIRWLGFRQTLVDVEHAERFAGRSAYSLGRLIRHTTDGIVSHSPRLLQASTCMGFGFGLFALIQIAYLIVRKLVYGIDVPGWASLMVVAWLVGGAVLFSLGVVGLYVGRIFEQAQGRPAYVIKARTGASGSAG